MEDAVEWASLPTEVAAAACPPREGAFGRENAEEEAVAETELRGGGGGRATSPPAEAAPPSMTSAEAPPPALCWKGPAELAAPAEDDADAMSLSLIDGGMLESAEIIDRVRSATGNGKPPKKVGTRYAG